MYRVILFLVKKSLLDMSAETFPLYDFIEFHLLMCRIVSYKYKRMTPYM